MGNSAGAKIAVYGCSPALTRRLISEETELRVEPVCNPVRFVEASEADPVLRRALILQVHNDEGWAMVADLAAHSHACPTTVIQPGDDASILRAISAGALAVVSRDAAPSRILAAAVATLAGDAVLPPAALELFAALLPVSAAVEGLTPHERAWLRWLAEGQSHQQIAARAGWSERQMRRRLVGLYLRLGVANRDQAVALAARSGVLA